MNTPSVRLPDNIHRAVKNSKYSIGDLARTGIEAAVVTGFNSVCWICGAGIHRKERSQQTTRDQIQEHIAHDSRVNWRLSNLPMNLEDHQQLQNHVAQTNDTNEADTYYQLAGDWLAVPDRPVDVCTECLDLLDQIRDRQIPLNELPVPYLFSEPKDRNKAGIDSEGARWNPMVAYATDVTAVALADYVSFQRRENKENKEKKKDGDNDKEDGDNDKEDGDNEKNKQDKEVFWWAARDRHQTVKYGLNLWRETAVRSHAHRLGWYNQPLPVFELSVERTPLNENRNQNQLAHQRPGLRESEKKDTLDSIQDGECCPGCGDKLPEFGPNYCSSCLFFGYYDSSFSNDCEAPFAPYIDGEFQSENVMKRCCECGELQDVDDEYVERFMKRYQPVFESMQYSIPMDIPENPQ